MTDPQERPRRSPAPRPTTPTIILLLVTGGLLLALGLWTADHRAEPAAPSGPPALAIVAPPDSAIVAAPLRLTFTTAAPLQLTPAGWRAGRYHLHALVDGAEVMPAAADIQALGNGRFLWQLGGVAPGLHHVRLVWARPDHLSIPEGASGTLRVQVQ